MTKDLRNKLDFVKHIVGKETTVAIAKVLQSSSPQDPWASFLATMIEAIDLSKDGSATSDERIGLGHMIKGYAEGRFKEEVRLRTPMGARGEMYFQAAKRMYGAANQREEAQLRNCIDKDRLPAHLAAKCGISPESAGSVFRKLLEVAVLETNACNVFQIPGIGRIVKAVREPILGENPQNGEPIMIPAQTTVRLLLDSNVRKLCGDDDVQRSPGERTDGESGPPVHPIPVEGSMAIIDDLSGRLKVIEQLVGEENTEAFAKVMRNSAAGDRLANVLQMLVNTGHYLNQVLSIIVTELGDASLDAGSASDDELKLFSAHVDEYVKGRQRLEFSHNIASINPRRNASIEATHEEHGQINETEATEPKGRMERPTLTAYLSTRCNIPQEAADAVLRELAESAVKETNAHKVFTIPGIGVIAKNFRKARIGRNPYTGKAEFLPARVTVKARLDQDLRIMCGDSVARADQQT